MHTTVLNSNCSISATNNWWTSNELNSYQMVTLILTHLFSGVVFFSKNHLVHQIPHLLNYLDYRITGTSIRHTTLKGETQIMIYKTRLP